MKVLRRDTKTQYHQIQTMDHTGEQNAQLKNYEFTPIGYMKEKQNLNTQKRPNESPTKNGNNPTIDENTMIGRHQSPPRKIRRTSIDDTIHSTRMFNDSMQFDETLPELDINIQSVQRVTATTDKKNLMSDLKDNAQTSNPLREQQDQLQKLNSENYNLKLKCNSLLKLLNNVTDQGELKKSLAFLDEIEEWKGKFSKTNQVYNDLKVTFDDLELKYRNLEIQVDKQEVIKPDHSHCVNEREILQRSINNITSEMNDLNNELDSLKALLLKRDSSLNSKEHELSEVNSRFEQLKDEIMTLQTSVEVNETYIIGYKEQIIDLTNKLKEANDIIGADNSELGSKINEKDNQIPVLEAKISELLKIQNEQKIELERKESYIIEAQTEFKKFREDIEATVNNSDSHDKLIRAQFGEIKQKNIALDTKLLQMNDENEMLSNKLLSLSNDLEDSRKQRKDEINFLNAQYELSKEEQLENIRILKEQLEKTEKQRHQLEEVTADKEKRILQLSQLLKDTETQSIQSTNLATHLEERYKNEINFLKEELQASREELSNANSLAQELRNQVINNATMSSKIVSKRLDDKNKEIDEFKYEIEILSKKLKDQIQSFKLDENKQKDLFSKKMKDLESNWESDKFSLERELHLLKSEKSSLIDSNKQDVDIWKTRVSALERENEILWSKDRDNHQELSKKLSERTKDLTDLMEKLTKAESEKQTLSDTFSKLQFLNEEYKTELRRTVTDLETVTQEYQKAKEHSRRRTINAGSEIELEETRKTLELLKGKYNNMKKDYLIKLTTLQDENLALEKKLSMKSDFSSRSSNHSQGDNNSTIQQDKIDYYRLKYYSEVKQNNDLKVMNEYLNRVMKASSQQIRLDMLKLKNEVNPLYSSSQGINRNQYFGNNPYDVYGMNYNSINLQKESYRRKFKVIALLVQSCVRMKHSAVRHKWDSQRINYLQRKITVDENRITW